MQAKHWFIITLIMTAVIMGTVATINVALDPLWCFEHVHDANIRQLGFNERQQKTNRLYFTSEDYDTVLCGSSRSTYINPADIQGMKVFNYAVKGMMPSEYAGFIRFAADCSGKPLKRVILGLDYFGRMDFGTGMRNAEKQPGTYIDRTTAWSYRYATVLSFSGIDYSISNWTKLYRGKIRRDHYRRDRNAAVPRPYDREALEARTSHYVETIRKGESEHGTWLPDHERYNACLRQLRDEYPGVEWLVFVTPQPAPVFRALSESMGIDEYERWLRDVVDIFGTVTNFMTINPVTSDYLEHFSDTSHFLPETGRLMMDRITHPKNATNTGADGGFGITVTAENLDTHLEAVRQSLGRVPGGE